MLTDQEIRDLVNDYGARVNEGRPIKQIIADNDIPQLVGATAQSCGNIAKPSI